MERHTIAAALLGVCKAEGPEVELETEAVLALSLYDQCNVNFADALLAARCLTEASATVCTPSIATLPASPASIGAYRVASICPISARGCAG